MTRPPLPVPGPDEDAPLDDAVIGRAFRVSLLVLVALAGLGALVWWLTRAKDAPPPKPAEPVAAPAVREKAAAAPDVRFTDVTAAAGIAWKHVTGARGDKWLPETMGAGAAFFDLEGDGDADLLLVNGTWWPGDPHPDAPAPTPALYRNDGAGRFEDVTAAFGLGVSFYGMGVAVGDADGDGDRDLCFTGVGGNRFFRRDAERFVEATAASGLAGDATGWTTGAGFFDADNDGDLDLFVCSYVQWSKEADRAINYTLDGTHRAFGPPKNYEGSTCRLYRNEGGLRFTDVTEAAGLVVKNPVTQVLVAKALGLAFVDVDGDGAVDVFVANDTTPNFLFKNRGNGTFEEVGSKSGVAYDAQGNSTGAMGVDVARLRSEGGVAIAVGNFANEMTSFYVAPRDPWRFTDMTIAEGIGAPSRTALKFGVLFLDYDLDGRLDFIQTNGHLEEEIEKVQRSQKYRQPSQLFWNLGPTARSTFGEVPRDRVGDLSRPVVGRGATSADIDGDGDLDLLITQCGDVPLLLRNEQALGHAWLRVRLEGRGGNTDALGARVTLRAGGGVQERWVSPTRSYLSQVEPTLTFGLGAATAVESLEVRWPDGTKQTVPVEGLRRTLVVKQP